jgi:TonB-linked SusC/RagA family outer membrane protein
MKKEKRQKRLKRNFLLIRIISLNVLLLLFCLNNLTAQTAEKVQTNKIKITGKVTDENGEVLPGVSVSVKGTAFGTVVDTYGMYSIEVPAGSALTFNMIGFAEENEAIEGRHEINVVMKDESLVLENIVVVGYGTQKKVSLVASISSIDTKEISRMATTSVSNAISGRIPGIITRQTSGEPGFEAAKIYVRGMSSWVNNAPLILVDGVERDINSVNPSDIESFSILKDASATAVYGVKGANGVILINTKRGKSGKPQITFRTETAILNSLSQRNYIDGYEYALLMNEGKTNSGITTGLWTEEELEKFRTGSDPYLYPNVDWVSEVLKPTSAQNINNLSVSGGNDIVRYYINVGYSYQDGIYRQDTSNDFNTNAVVNRYNYRSNIDINLTKDLAIDLGIGGIIDDRNYPGAGAAGILDGLRDTGPIAFPKLNPDGSIAGINMYVGSNPWGQATQSGYSDEHLSTIQSTFGAKWDLSTLITKGLSIKGRFSFDFYHANKALRYKVFGVKEYLGKNELGEDMYNVNREEQGMGYSIGQNSNRSIYMDLGLNYDRTFGDHYVSGLLLFNRRSHDNLSAGTTIANLPARNQGIASRLTYNYVQRYFLEFNAGYNGSENFPKGKRMGFFPAVSLGWLVSNESFWNNNSFVSNLKFRASHGKVGNDNVGGARFLYLTSMNKNNGDQYAVWGTDHIRENSITEAQMGYNNVTWETATKTNLGFDLGLWNGRITLQTDFFNENREGILIQRQSVPSATGFQGASILYGNLGVANNKGMDGLLEIKTRTSSGLFYSFRVNATYAHNEIVKNDRPTPLYPNLSELGHPIGQNFGLVALGFFETQEEADNWLDQSALGGRPGPGDIKYADVNENGIIDVSDTKAIGYPRTPEFMFGFGGTLEYKGIDFSAFFSGATNTSVFFEGRSFYPFDNGMGYFNIFQEYYDNRWIPNADNSHAKYPRVIDGPNVQTNRRSTVWLQDASYLRLKNLEIGYTLPKNWVKAIKLSDLRVFVNGTNLYTWDKINHTIDPESDNWYPIQRAFNFGLSVNF